MILALNSSRRGCTLGKFTSSPSFDLKDQSYQPTNRSYLAAKFMPSNSSRAVCLSTISLEFLVVNLATEEMTVLIEYTHPDPIEQGSIDIDEYAEHVLVATG